MAQELPEMAHIAKETGGHYRSVPVRLGDNDRAIVQSRGYEGSSTKENFFVGPGVTMIPGPLSLVSLSIVAAAPGEYWIDDSDSIANVKPPNTTVWHTMDPAAGRAISFGSGFTAIENAIITVPPGGRLAVSAAIFKGP